MRLVRLAPNVSVAAITVTASTAPVSTDLTGTAVRPRPGSSANRSPATPVAPSPAPEPGAHQGRAAVGAVRAGGGAVRRLAVADDRGHPAEDQDERERAQPEHRGVDVEPSPRLGLPDRPEKRERGQRDRDGDGEQGPGDHGGEHPEHAVGGGGQRAGAERPQDARVVGGRAKLPGHRLGADDQRGEPGDQPEHARARSPPGRSRAAPPPRSPRCCRPAAAAATGWIRRRRSRSPGSRSPGRRPRRTGRRPLPAARCRRCRCSTA